MKVKLFAEGGDKNREETKAPVLGDVEEGVDKDLDDQLDIGLALFRNERGQDLLDGLLDHGKRILIILAEHVGTHKREDGHDAREHAVCMQRGDRRQKQQGVVVGLRALAAADALHDGVDAENAFVQLLALLEFLLVGGKGKEARQHELLDVLEGCCIFHVSNYSIPNSTILYPWT